MSSSDLSNGISRSIKPVLLRIVAIWKRYYEKAAWKQLRLWGNIVVCIKITECNPYLCWHQPNQFYKRTIYTSNQFRGEILIQAMRGRLYQTLKSDRKSHAKPSVTPKSSSFFQSFLPSFHWLCIILCWMSECCVFATSARCVFTVWRRDASLIWEVCGKFSNGLGKYLVHFKQCCKPALFLRK